MIKGPKLSIKVTWTLQISPRCECESSVCSMKWTSALYSLPLPNVS